LRRRGEVPAHPPGRRGGQPEGRRAAPHLRLARGAEVGRRLERVLVGAPLGDELRLKRATSSWCLRGRGTACSQARLQRLADVMPLPSPCFPLHTSPRSADKTSSRLPSPARRRRRVPPRRSRGLPLVQRRAAPAPPPGAAPRAPDASPRRRRSPPPAPRPPRATAGPAVWGRRGGERGGARRRLRGCVQAAAGPLACHARSEFLQAPRRGRAVHLVKMQAAAGLRRPDGIAEADCSSCCCCCCCCCCCPTLQS